MTDTRTHPAIALAVISIAQLMIVLDATVMNVALPSIKTDLGFSATGLTWVITAYSLTFGGLLLFGGRTGDLFGRRRMFCFGIGVFGLASLLGGFAQTEWMLIAARALQGVGGAIAAPTALSLIATTFEEGDARNRAFAVFAAMAASGGALGLLLGGLLTDYASWRWALFINAPIGIAVLLIAPRVLPESRGSGARLDVPGAIAITLGMSSLVYGLTTAATDGWGDTVTITALTASAVLVALFVVIERRHAAPLLPLRMLGDRDRTGAYLMMLLLAGALFACFFFSSQYLQVVHGYSPVRTGFAFLPMPALIMFMSIVVVRRLIPRIGVRPFLIAGPISATAAMFVLASLDVGSSYPHVLAGLLLLGFGMGCIFVPLTVTAVTRVAPHETGIASALLNTGQQLGGAIGLATLGTLAAHADDARAEELVRSPLAREWSPAHLAADVFTHGQHAAFLGATVLTVGALVASLALVRMAHPERRLAPATTSD